MQYVSMAIVGLIVGIIARFVYPGAVPLGLLASAGLGIGGSFLAGIIGNLIHKPADGKVIHPAGFIYSILGALLLIFVARRLGLV